MARTPDQLADLSVKLIEQAITEGKIKLQNGQEFKLEISELVGLLKWLGGAKIKKPDFVETPEGFLLKKTSKEDDSGEEEEES